MRIHCVVKPGQSPDYHRIVIPMLNMHFSEEDNCNMIFTGEETEELWDCDVLMFNRDIATTASELCSLRDKYGFKIVVDLDDYWEIPYNHPLYKTWLQDDRAKALQENIRIADLVLVTTQFLASQVNTLNFNVFVVPNCLEEQPIKTSTDPKVRFMYTGGHTHTADLELLEGRFKRIGTDSYIKKNGVFIFTGYDESPYMSNARRIFKLTESYGMRHLLPLDEYMTNYDHADVVLVPLVDNKFNNCKSELKIIEAGMKGLPCIVSRVKPYTELEGFPGILWVDKPQDWLEHIRFCINSKSSLENAGHLLREYITKHFNLAHWNIVRYELIKSIL